MTPLSARAKKDRLLRVFERTGGAGHYTRPVDSLPESAQQQIRHAARTREGEEPILASYRDERDWVLLTSDRLIVRTSTIDTTLPWSEIANATVEPAELRRAAVEQSEGKLHLRLLRIVRSDGGVLDIEVEPGPSFIALWNVLKTVAVMRRHA
jgi:hypothetical protein